MELRQMNKGDADLKTVRAIFLEAFPKVERPPFRVLTRKLGTGMAELWGVYDAGKLMGFAEVILSDTAVYLFFLAMHRDCRGKGHGGFAVRELIKKYAGKKFFLALESLTEEGADNMEERIRRHGFYTRQGLHDLPVQLREGGVTFDAMGVGEAPTKAEYEGMMRRFTGWYHLFVGFELLKRA